MWTMENGGVPRAMLYDFVVIGLQSMTRASERMGNELVHSVTDHHAYELEGHPQPQNDTHTAVRFDRTTRVNKHCPNIPER